MEICPHISRRILRGVNHDQHKVERLIFDMNKDCNTSKLEGSQTANGDDWQEMSNSDIDDFGLSLDEDDNDIDGDHFSGRFKLRRQSSSMVFDPNDIDNVIAQQNEMTVENEKGMILTLHTEDSSTQSSGIPVYHIDNITDITSSDVPTSHLRTMNSVSSTSSTMSSPSKRSSMHGRAGYEKASKNRIEIVSLHCNTLFSHDLCFTHFQAMEYWMQKSPSLGLLS